MNLEPARQAMINQQVRSWDVTDPTILDCLARVPREHFVPDGFVTLAFADTAIPLGHGQSMLKPVVEGRMLQALRLEQSHRALVIGTGSGFVTACVARLVDHVTSVEIIPELHARARAALTAARVHNLDLQQVDFNELKPNHGFDRILVAGSVPVFDARFAEWLRPGGECVAIIGAAPAMSVERIRRNDEHYTRETLFETVVAPLLNVTQQPAFTF